jgi:hypothetical protein
VPDKKNIISLNGKLYDAKTGAVFTHTLGGAVHHTKNTPHAGNGKILDGFITIHKLKPARHEAHQPAPAHAQHPIKKVAAHQPQRAKTLMRSAVKKPASVQSSHIQKAGSTPETNSQPIITAPAHVDAVRFSRAQEVNRSKFITRFNPATSPKHLVKKSAHIALKTPPKTEDHITGHISAPVVEPEVSSSSGEHQDIFAEALSLANSHQETGPVKTKRRHRAARKLHLSSRAMNVSISILIVFALGGFIALQNKPNIEMRLAASKAGMHASLPGYQPAGFSFKNVLSAPGAVKVSFISNTDNSRAFSILQSTSNWNSETLRDSFVATASQPYQTREANGKTIYLYGDSNATWVDGGVWYKVEGNSSLNSTQLLNIASSL